MKRSAFLTHPINWHNISSNCPSLQRPLPEDDGFYTSPDREKLKENAPALPGAGTRKEQQNIRSQMRREEERQTKEDRFWGLDNEARHQVQDGKFMAEADAHSLACRDKEKREQQHAEWEQLGQERKDEIKWRMDAKNSEARRAYMRMFFVRFHHCQPHLPCECVYVCMDARTHTRLRISPQFS
jgi:hypothetical protein